MCGRIIGLAEDAPRGGPPLALRDDPGGLRVAVRLRPLQCVLERVSSGLTLLLALERGYRPGRLPDFDDPARGRDDGLEQVARGRRHDAVASLPDEETTTSRSSTARARPLSIASPAVRRPSATVAECPAMSNDAAAFKRTISRAGPSFPSRISRAIKALSAASPPRRSADAALGTPKSAGCT